ncbi:MAG: hypothetical protein IPI13_06925 [Actinomycetales bacterium]|mgnify:FL=1|jgi:hypothetical protein|uniref:Uncharacterized protein n=1 Tax=Candidatus Phosphoribacter hodrii TaxID=2953743 RepID=A0A934X572_9MICO|nr:hypothetical protein [Candidatus Phosphoribacter hodrii]OPZ48470.1 MAG: hypothetical protein BWY91_03192 [bacterium ADurb.BinA028]HOA01562.1 hypothetical protein [Dermatophilaceae bacterium]MBK7272906.1 hypothetical protein [Candidatus Phosphoribacter hodrii]MBL0004727.1 hypothetical protein [Candidatus Phosphoribacter hodrii]
MTGSMTWDEGGAGEASGQVASMADAVQAQSRRLAGITVNQGDATGMIRELLHTWATELDLRGEALDVWATAVRAQTETVARTDHRMRLA